MPQSNTQELSASLSESLSDDSDPAIPQVGIVVVTYNSNSHLRNLISSLEKQTNQSYDLLVVDCHSRKSQSLELQELSRQFKFKLLLSPENLGFAGGNNLGLRLAIAREYPFVWMLNADTSLEPDSLQLILEEANNNPSYSVFGTKVLSKTDSGETKVWSLGGFIKKEEKQVGMYTSEGEMPEEVDYIPGCSMFFRSECLDRIGKIPEDYFMYFEETAWCQNIKEAGYSLKILPNVRVWHHFDNSKMNSAQNTYFYNRSYYRFWLKNSSFISDLRFVIKVFTSNLINSAYAYLKAPDAKLKSLFKAHIYACLDFFFGRKKPRVFN